MPPSLGSCQAQASLDLHRWSNQSKPKRVPALHGLINAAHGVVLNELPHRGASVGAQHICGQLGCRRQAVHEGSDCSLCCMALLMHASVLGHLPGPGKLGSMHPRVCVPPWADAQGASMLAQRGRKAAYSG